MAIYHLSVKAISRSAGRSSTAAAAYRAGCEIADKRTGEIHDYTRKGGIASTDLVLPDDAPEWAADRSALWNAAEAAERRKDACVAREFEVALPDELSPDERRRLAVDFAKEMANAEGCAVDVSIHAPGKEGDSRNHHAHILRTTRKVGPEGLTDKLDTEKAGRNRAADLDAVRTRWAVLTNERLRENGIAARVDHRSLEVQKIDREPTKHLGPAASGYERRTGQPSDKRIQQEREAVERLTKAKAAGELERESRQLDRLILYLSGDLSAAKVEHDRLPTPEVKQAAASGVADFRAQFEQAKLVEAGKQQARQVFEQFKAEQQAQQRQAELAKEQAAKALANHREEAERKQQAERAPKPKIDRGGPSLG
jgi:ATP-dependent exoDNAse (exonuclease V) alpha subunit